MRDEDVLVVATLLSNADETVVVYSLLILANLARNRGMVVLMQRCLDNAVLASLSAGTSTIVRTLVTQLKYMLSI